MISFKNLFCINGIANKELNKKLQNLLFKNNIPLISKIIQTLNKVSSERQIPSKGLNIAQMSFASKKNANASS